MNNETIAALLFIALSFILKCLIGRKPTFDVLMPYLIELPMDIIFLSIGCTASLIITQNKDAFIFFLIQIIASIAVTYWCRTSVDAFDSMKNPQTPQVAQTQQTSSSVKKIVLIVFLTIASFIVSGVIFLISIS